MCVSSALVLRSPFTCHTTQSATTTTWLLCSKTSLNPSHNTTPPTPTRTAASTQFSTYDHIYITTNTVRLKTTTVFISLITDQLSVNVTLGQLYMSYRFDMSIKSGSKNVTGWARGRTLVDQYSFLKRVFIIDGGLEWDPYNIRPMDINSQFSIEYSEPKITMNETTIYIQLLNDYLGT